MDTWLRASLIAILILLLLAFLLCLKALFLGDDSDDYAILQLHDNATRDIPRDFLNDEESMKHLAAQFDFVQLSPEEQVAYLRGEEFTKNNPPKFYNTRGRSLTPENELLIKDLGLSAYEFEQEADPLSARYLVADKTDLLFQNNDTPYSTATAVLNFPLPVKNRSFADTVYFEVKVFEYVGNTENPNGHFGIGLVTKPYPAHFRLPGYNSFSIAYESTGNLKINKPFPTPLQQHCGDQSVYNAQVLPPLEQSDVVGFGYSILSGTIFITRNGRKMMDIMLGCYVDLFPAVGCFSTNAKFQANFGQLGYVWIEANVRKYGFVSTHDFKKIQGDRGLATLPDYNIVNKENKDKILEKGDVLPPGYPDGELDFFGRSLRDPLREGTSSNLQGKSDALEKSDFCEDLIEQSEVKSLIDDNSPRITYHQDDVMDQRTRNYERATSQSAQIDEIGEAGSLEALQSPDQLGLSLATEGVEDSMEPPPLRSGQKGPKARLSTK